jgi:hypothetical protein
MSEIHNLFQIATDKKRVKPDRTAAFREIRRLSLYGSPGEVSEARLALEYSALYQQFNGDTASILRALGELHGNQN